MPVVINEFEVVPEAPASDRGAASTPDAGQGAAPAPDVTRVLQRLHDRALRVRAH